MNAVVGVVLIVVDALRPDHLGAYGYARATSPRLDRLARGGVVFEDAAAPANWTLPSLASLMTSLYPSVHGAARFPARQDWPEALVAGRFKPGPGEALGPVGATLAERLRAAGYHTGAIVSGGFCRSAFGLSRGFDDYRNEGGPLSDLAPAILEWLDARRGEKFFLYLHLGDVHDPYAHGPAYDSLWDADYRGPMDGSRGALFRAAEGELAPADLRRMVALYDGGIAFLDQHIGSILDRLEGRAIVIVTADHGESFHEHGRLLHGNSPYQEALRVPLIVSAPGAAPRRVDAPVSILDVYPTVLELLDLPPAPGVDGRSLVPLLQGRSAPARELAAEIAELPKPLTAQTLRVGRWKLVRRLDGGRDELYDLESDPFEKTDVSGNNRELRGELEDELDSWRRAAAARSLNPASPQAEIRSSLRAGGYER